MSIVNGIAYPAVGFRASSQAPSQKQKKKPKRFILTRADHKRMQAKAMRGPDADYTFRPHGYRAWEPAKCPECGNDFMRPVKAKPKKAFCSRPCACRNNRRKKVST